MTKLKHCPFCGNQPRHLEHNAGFYTERVICATCGFHLTATRTLTAVQNWNQRITQEVTDNMVDNAARLYNPSTFGNQDHILAGTALAEDMSTKHMIRLMLQAALNTES